jgi:hypothetical protein
MIPKNIVDTCTLIIVFTLQFKLINSEISLVLFYNLTFVVHLILVMNLLSCISYLVPGLFFRSTGTLAGRLYSLSVVNCLEGVESI